MCGIFGGIGIPDPLSNLQKMGRTLKHRGPDDEGFFIEGDLALGHTRLSIIDLSSGKQPMSSSNGQCVIVFNGEIYNFGEIRNELLKKGHLFHTLSDTEVILNSYLEWGVDCLDRFNGMFAFALWDKLSRKLWIARDRLGKKPIYLWFSKRMFVFASEAKTIWNLPFFEGTYDFRAVDQYLSFRYVPGERTFHKEIKKLLAGHWILLDDRAQIVQQKQWWSIPSIRDVIPGKSLQAYRDEFQQIFSSAVKLRLIADVPLGAFLSSGIDSVSIASEMAKVSRPTFFTIGFGGEVDEVNAASMIAKELGGQHHVLQMGEDDFDQLPKAVASMDEPYGDPIILPTFLLAKKASEIVKVVLTGDGADEVMGGYIHHVFFRNMPVLPSLLGKSLALIARGMPLSVLDKAFHYPAGMGEVGRKRMVNLIENYPDGIYSYLGFATLFSPEDKKSLYTKEFNNSLADEPNELWDTMKSHFGRTSINIADLAVQWDLKTWFPEQTLMKFDRLTMANSIEGRCPYADYRLVEFFLRLPPRYYQLLCNKKNIVREIYQAKRPFLPRKKNPFYLPMHKRFEEKLRKFQDEILDSVELNRFKWFKPDAISRLRHERTHSPLLLDKQIMSLVVLFYWLRTNKGGL